MEKFKKENKMIITKLPIYFYDDRSKDDTIMIVGRILFEDEKVCLVETDDDKEVILFNKEDGEVLTSNFEFWYATNENPQIKGDWVFEISSGFDGFRCTKCKTWIYSDQHKKCKCD
jgi:hypothetical protein